MTHYTDQRYWILHELRRCRAMARQGHLTKTERKALQRELAKLRRARR